MISKRYISYLSVFIITCFMLPNQAMSQEVKVLDPYNVNQESITDQIFADTVGHGDDTYPDGIIYELESGQVYINDTEIQVRGGSSLHFRSTDPTEKAIVYQFPTGSGDNPQNPPGHFVRVYDGNLTVEGLAITGFYEPGFEDDETEYDQLYTVQGGLFRNDSENATIILRNNVFSNVSGQILRVQNTTKKIVVEDNILANLGSLATSNLGAGKGLDLRESIIDSLIVVNNTFVNYQDRAIRHYNFGNPTEGTGDIVYGLIDHNTFVNGMGYHGLLSLGNMGDKMIITNNLFVDAFASGEDSTDAERTAEWGNVGEEYENGNNKMSWIFGAPDEDVEYIISNNFYAQTAAGIAWQDKYEEVTIGQPLSNFIMEQLGDAAETAFTLIDDPELADVPELMVGIMDYYMEIAEKTKNTPHESWDPAIHDMDRRPIGYYVNTFDASYSESSEAYTGAEGGFPAGDLNWFPEAKAEWLTTSTDPQIAIPNNFALRQNYPNPFNPSTTISYDISTAANVHIEVYDVLGQKVATLINGDFHSSGSYSITFNASNLSSGIYFYTLKAGNVLQTRKMTLLK